MFMTICPIAIAVGCKKCPLYRSCPAKYIIGDVKNPKRRKDDKKE